MKIAHVVDSMEVGGAEKIISLLCRFQKGQGHGPSVHCLYALGPLAEELQGEGINVTLHGPASLPSRLHSLFRAFRKERADVVHCHNRAALIMAAIPSRLAGARCVVATRHGLVAPPYSIRGELKFAMASRWCDWVVGVCDGTVHNLREAPFAARDRMVRIYNGAEAVSIDGELPRKEGFTLLHVGRLSAPKDQRTLLDAFALALRKNANIRLWIVGDGPCRDELQAHAENLGVANAVRFFGEQAAVGRFYCSADLFVMSSISEGLPMSLLEAMSAGLPAVLTDVGGMSELGRISGAATVVPPRDAEALAQAILSYASCQEEVESQGKMVRNCFNQFFTLERMAAEYERLYLTGRSSGAD